MITHRFTVMARWRTNPNDPYEYDVVRKNVKTRKEVVTITNWFIKEVRPFQISITDHYQDEVEVKIQTREDMQKALEEFDG